MFAQVVPGLRKATLPILMQLAFAPFVVAPATAEFAP
jgi:hypothetical protein